MHDPSHNGGQVNGVNPGLYDATLKHSGQTTNNKNPFSDGSSSYEDETMIGSYMGVGMNDRKKRKKRKRRKKKAEKFNPKIKELESIYGDSEYNGEQSVRVSFNSLLISIIG